MNNPANFLALEGVLLARLADQLANISPRVHVLAAVDLAGVTEATQVTPAVHVVYQGYNLTEIRSDGSAARIEQTWLVTVATRNMSTLGTGKAARADAGLIARRVLKALMGYKPEPGSKPLRLTSGPGAGFNAGYQYLPMAFVAELVMDNT